MRIALGINKREVKGWRDCLVVDGTGCFSREPRFNFKYPCSDSKPYLTPVPGIQ